MLAVGAGGGCLDTFLTSERQQISVLNDLSVNQRSFTSISIPCNYLFLLTI